MRNIEQFTIINGLVILTIEDYPYDDPMFFWEVQPSSYPQLEGNVYTELIKTHINFESIQIELAFKQEGNNLVMDYIITLDNEQFSGFETF